MYCALAENSTLFLRRDVERVVAAEDGELRPGGVWTLGFRASMDAMVRTLCVSRGGVGGRGGRLSKRLEDMTLYRKGMIPHTFCQKFTKGNPAKQPETPAFAHTHRTWDCHRAVTRMVETRRGYQCWSFMVDKSYRPPRVFAFLLDVGGLTRTDPAARVQDIKPPRGRNG